MTWRNLTFTLDGSEPYICEGISLNGAEGSRKVKFLQFVSDNQILRRVKCCASPHEFIYLLSREAG